ncbi:TPA: FAD-dependent oxidoreductase, partial [Raoultella planticola]|nr:FAD-dependent oxidoreductase [Raoultella planticola]
PGLPILRRHFAGWRAAYPAYRSASRRPAQAQRRRAALRLRAFVVSEERMKEAFALLKQLGR